jgi:hypothetical protein
MRINQLAEALKVTYRAPIDKRVAVFARGLPGCGKSGAGKSAARDLAGELNLPFRDLDREPWSAACAESFCYLQLQATIEDPITLSGLPARDGDHAVFLAFKDKLPTAGRGILEIAEINTAPPSVQAGFYALFLTGKLGSYHLPDGWLVYATGNRDGDRAATQRMPTPLIGRLCFVDIENDLAAWTRWAVNNGVRPEVIGFYQYKPDLFDTFDPTSTEPYSGPRSAERASHVMSCGYNGLENAMLEGVVGKGVGIEMAAFIEIYRSLASPAMIIKDPAGAPIPVELSAIVSTATALAFVADKDNLAPILVYLQRLPQEYAMLGLKIAIKRDHTLQQTAAFIKYASKPEVRALFTES